MTYKRKNAYVWSIRHKCVCQSCSKLGRECSEEQRKLLSQILTGRTITWGDEISKALKGRHDTPETIKRKQIAMKGKKNPFYGHKHTAKTKRKIRLKAIKRLQERCGGGACPTYNPTACQIITEYGRQNEYNFQHAMNGGEFYIKELGYWVDGYDKKKNVVIEYYENDHRRTNKKIRDVQRMNEIVETLGCKFIVLKEWDDVPIIIN